MARRFGTMRRLNRQSNACSAVYRYPSPITLNDPWLEKLASG